MNKLKVTFITLILASSQMALAGASFQETFLKVRQDCYKYGRESVKLELDLEKVKDQMSRLNQSNSSSRRKYIELKSIAEAMQQAIEVGSKFCNEDI